MVRIPLKNICRKITDGSHNPPAGVSYSQYLMISSKNVEDDNISFDEPRYLSESDFEVENRRTCIEPDDLLLTIVGSIGRVAVVPQGIPNFCLQRSVCVLKLKSAIAYPPYLMYQIQSMRKLLEQEAHGVAQKGIYLRQVEQLPVYIPCMTEQIHIASIFKKISGLISLRKQQLIKLDELVKARFVEIFGDPITNSHCWERIAITDVCYSIYSGGTPSKSHPEYFEGTIPWVSPKDMKVQKLFNSIDHITEEAIKNSSTNLVPPKSVLMVIRSGILKHSLPVAINTIPVTINQDMKAFVPNKTITAEYLMYYFKAIEADVLCGVRGVTADNIDFKEFQRRQILVPPIMFQKKFSVFVEQADKFSLTIQQSLDKLDVLKKALMQKYFG